MKAAISRVDLVRPLARRTAVTAFIAAALLTIGPPLAVYWQGRGAREGQADSYARRMADLVREVVVTQPELWYYDAPKLSNHLKLLASVHGIERVVVIDGRGRRLDVPEPDREDGLELLWWAKAPVFRGQDREVAQVWVAIDATEGIAQVLLVLLLSFGLGAALSTTLYAMPVIAVTGAERRIIGLLEKLESARQELSELNSDLERRVSQRSKQLAQTAEALRGSEARLREVAGRAVEATEQERQRVAQELHDGVGQMLTAIHISLQVCLSTLEAESPTGARVLEAERLVDDSIDELRRIAMNLHPAALDRLGLLEGLRELCHSVAASAGLKVDFSVDLQGSLPTAVESSCYRLIQECLNNIVRYARAENVEVRIERSRSAVTIQVTDDGVGFDPDEPSLGLGLRGMRDRAALLGGTLSLESAPGRGSTIRAVLPLKLEASDDGAEGHEPR